MLLSTTPTFENNPIKEYKGVVTGETIIGANALKDLKASITDFFGGRSSSYERVLAEGKETSLLSSEPMPSWELTSTMRPLVPMARCSWWLAVARQCLSDKRKCLQVTW